MSAATTTTAARVLATATAPALLFAARPEDDDAGVLDLRTTDLPASDVMVRNEVRRRWRAAEKLVVRIDEHPTASVQALLLELSRREVRLTADEVERFDANHTVLVKTAAPTPPASLVRFFPIRLRAEPSAASFRAHGSAHARRR